MEAEGASDWTGTAAGGGGWVRKVTVNKGMVVAAGEIEDAAARERMEDVTGEVEAGSGVAVVDETGEGEGDEDGEATS